MARGRRKLTDPPVEWKVSVPTSLAARAELILLDPVKQTIGYGERSKLLTKLLKAWVDAQTSNVQD